MSCKLCCDLGHCTDAANGTPILTSYSLSSLLSGTLIFRLVQKMAMFICQTGSLRFKFNVNMNACRTRQCCMFILGKSIDSSF